MAAGKDGPAPGRPILQCAGNLVASHDRRQLACFESRRSRGLEPCRRGSRLRQPTAECPMTFGLSRRVFLTSSMAILATRSFAADKIKPDAKSALIVTDVQNCFVDGGTLPV